MGFFLLLTPRYIAHYAFNCFGAYGFVSSGAKENGLLGISGDRGLSALANSSSSASTFGPATAGTDPVMVFPFNPIDDSDAKP